MSFFRFPQSFRKPVENHMAQNLPQPGRPRRHTGNLCSCPVRGFFSGKGILVIPSFFSASWQWGDSCLPGPDKNSSTSVRREPNIGVRRSRTALGDRCISEPTMFSVPGGTPSAGIAKGDPLAGFLGTLSPQKEFPWGAGGRSAPAKGGVGESPT